MFRISRLYRRLMPSTGRFRWRLGQARSCRNDDQRSSHNAPMENHRSPRRPIASLRVRRLEPRLVLNATAELTGLGQLLVSGTDAGDTIQLQSLGNGDLQLRDQAGQIIPISGHPEGASMSDRPLNVSSITSREMVIDLQGGDDSADLQLVPGLNIHVMGSAGFDRTTLHTSSENGSVDTVQIESDQIQFQPSRARVNFANDRYQLTGDLIVGRSQELSRHSIDGGTVQLDGRFIVAGDVAIRGHGSFEFGDALVTSQDASSRLTIDLELGSQVAIGGIGQPGESVLRELTMAVGGPVTLGAHASLGERSSSVGGMLSIQSDSDITVAGPVIAEAIQLSSRADLNVQADTSLASVMVNDPGDQIGRIGFHADGVLRVSAAIDASQQVGADIDLSGGLIQLNHSQLTTQGGDIHLGGPLGISGDVILTSGADRTAQVAGVIEIADSVHAEDVGATLTIDALAAPEGQSGGVRILDSIGAVVAGSVEPNSLRIDAETIQIHDTVVHGGPIELSATNIELTGVRIETIETGDIVFDGAVLLPSGNGRIDAAGSVEFRQSIEGRDDSNDLIVTAGQDIRVLGAVSNIDGLFVNALRTARVDGRVDLSAGFDVTAETVEITADVQTGDAFLDRGDLRISGDRRVVVDRGAVLHSGSNQLIIDAGGGRIELGDGNLISEHAGEAIILRNADHVRLGNVIAGRGSLVIGVPTVDPSESDTDNMNLEDGLPSVGSVRQAAGTTLEIESLVADVDTNLQLDQSANQIEQLRKIRTQDGPITVDVTGTMTVLDVRANNVSGLSSIDSQHDVRLTVHDVGDLHVRTVVAANGGDVHLESADDLLDSDFDDDQFISADDLNLIARNNQESADALTDSSSLAIQLTTDVNDLAATVLGQDPGGLQIHELGDIRLATSDAMSDQEQISTSNGPILISADGDITVLDAGLVSDQPPSDGSSRNPDAEIAAHGSEGRIDLSTEFGQISLLDQVQLRAEKVTRAFDATVTEEFTGTLPSEHEIPREDRAVFIKAKSIVLGAQIEINTGGGQGIAHSFAPRPEPLPLKIDPITGDLTQMLPDVPDINAAFYIPSSVETNILEQAVVNDATGILTLRIGQPGERGLTLDIDWGAPNEPGEDQPARFQRINGITSGDTIVVATNVDETGIGKAVQPRVSSDGDGRLRVEHFYTQANIVDSTLNNRIASTKPLEVRFSVRHHDSIRIEADTVQQGNMPLPERDFGSVVSSTDDPGQAGLQNGRATFLIPSLTVPVAFFPVRNVIPEFELPELTIRTDSIEPVTQITLETVDSSSSPLVAGDAYLQIRVLSPDPTGETVAVRRISIDLLEGDQLQQLFSELPDGRYEIEYVTGDAASRTLLRVDVRGGLPTFPDDMLDEGVLRLTPEDALDRQDQDSDATPRGAEEGLDRPRENGSENQNQTSDTRSRRADPHQDSSPDHETSDGDAEAPADRGPRLNEPDQDAQSSAPIPAIGGRVSHPPQNDGGIGSMGVVTTASTLVGVGMATKTWPRRRRGNPFSVASRFAARQSLKRGEE